ncbi:iron donor protein CyaY [Glaciimonas soli]|uniref:Iron-sulfur cluster assembly protein CyaY n=1 Tax=Glaciimonas soli TaxID=2590999 RepID=A0A843YYY8_9BURK|nr:iron donor protein CyaY [Glaciimonas soli]MQR02688.1 iron donor protein CyaY [Glaciimonas soli]
MTESEFLVQVEATLNTVEQALEHLSNNDEIDVECERKGNVLEIEFIDNGSKIIVNSQAAMQELWLAAKSGGYHFKYKDNAWRNTRDSSEFFAALSKAVSDQGGVQVTLRP